MKITIEIDVHNEEKDLRSSNEIVLHGNVAKLRKLIASRDFVDKIRGIARIHLARNAR